MIVTLVEMAEIRTVAIFKFKLFCRPNISPFYLFLIFYRYLSKLKVDLLEIAIYQSFKTISI